MSEEKKREECPEDQQDENASKKQKVQHETESLDEKIQKQLEYYFSDVNVINDRFLQQQFKKEAGWVKLSVLLTFKRLQDLTKDESRIVEALKDFTSEIIEFDAEKKAIRRKKPTPDAEEFAKELESRSIHISGFPSNSNFDDLNRYCSVFGEIESLSMRRHFKTRFFKGCVHIVYKSDETVKKILAFELLKFKDRELRTEAMDKYHMRKREFKLRGKKPRQTGPSGTTIN